MNVITQFQKVLNVYRAKETEYYILILVFVLMESGMMEPLKIVKTVFINVLLATILPHA